MELVFEKQADLRFKNVKLWHSGLRLHGPGKIITSEHELLEACEPAIEKVNALMEWASSNAGKSTRALKRFRTLERQAVDGGKALYEVYFDINLSLRGIGRELLSVAKALTPYSREAATVFRDLIVLWSDLMNPENLEEELSRRQVQTPELFQLDAEERRENLSDDRTPPRRLRTSEGSSPPIVKQKGETDEKTEVRTTSSSSKEVQSPVLQEKPVAPSPNKKEQSAKKKKLVNLDRMMHAISTMMKPLTEADLGLKFGTEELKDFVARLEVAVSSEAKSTSKSTGLSVYDTGLKYARAIQKLMKAYDAASGDLDKFRASPLASHFLAILKSGNSRSAFTAFSAAL